MPTPPEIIQLVKRFEANLDTYRSGEYNETLLRRDFLDPFFRAFGWDIDNSQGYAEAFREVVHEDAIKVVVPRDEIGIERALMRCRCVYRLENVGM